jgi:hypothetical protein
MNDPRTQQLLRELETLRAQLAAVRPVVVKTGGAR